ncbi:hypothetical protein LCGC14_0490910 [marine sediment metagenome]|uniref:Uncharacterized protein n=1 Tax=marine sediment metagenome TaxID=412755 RepID=A0A0F9VFA4_9ZZZZ
MYQFPVAKAAKSAKQERQRKLKDDKLEERLPTVIQGKPVNSVEEARIAVGLEILGWRFVYQKAYYGGRSTAGGIIVDFLVLTPGSATPLLMQSRYWHTIRDRRAKDFYQISRLSRIPNLANPIEIWDYSVRTIQQTVRTLVAVLGNP